MDVDGRSWFLAVFNPPLELVVVGAAHIAQPLTQMAALAVTTFASSIRARRSRRQSGSPGMALSHEWPDEALARAPLGARSALVALTHDPKVDDPALAAALRSNCFYIGALGSKKSHAGRLARLKAQGFGDDALARIHGPVGLDIGARSPAEIAVSILAEITARPASAAAVKPSVYG